MPHGCVITIGNYDGVHVGHRAILQRARELAAAHAVRVVALSFEPHPARILRPGAEPPRLQTTEERIVALREAGADQVELLEPTPTLLGMTAEQFVRALVDRYRPVVIVEGPDFRFGKGRQGDMTYLAAAGRELGFTVDAVGQVQIALHDLLLAPVSSSLIRWLVGHGRVADAARCLGRPFSLTSLVTEGEKRGRTLGIPTTNFDAAALGEHVIPADGVYAGVADLHDGRRYAAAISIGVKPTFGQARRLIEAHLLDFAGDLYGRTLTLRFGRWVRDQYRFPGLPALKAQLARDLTETRRLHEQGLLEQASPSPVVLAR